MLAKCGVLVNIFAKTPQFLLPYIDYPQYLQDGEKEEDWKVINVLEVLVGSHYIPRGTRMFFLFLPLYSTLLQEA